jgi:HEPN domain-containing protein
LNTFSLSDEYLRKAKIRRRALDVIRSLGGHDDVVRESQELVELLLKGLLRRVGIDPPKWHDVSRVIEQHQNLFNDEIRNTLPRLISFSSRLRKDRELSFYGDEDFMPSQNFHEADSQQCCEESDWLIGVVERFYASNG